MNICFIGFGNMAKAIAQSLSEHKNKYQVVGSSPSLKKGQTPEGILTSANNLEALAKADIVVLAVKPAKMAEILAQIKTKLPKHCLLISVAAGLTLSWLEQHCCPGQALVRSMPNLPIAVKKGATILIANPYVSAAQKGWVDELFQHSGMSYWTEDEREIDSFTALSGSGPAYVFLFLEAMIAAAKRLGLSADIAKDFSLQTVAGALEMAARSELEIAELRRKVTSPTGTTAAAIATLDRGGFTELIFKAMAAAKARAKELSE